MVTQWSSFLRMHQRKAGVPKLKMVKAPEVYGKKKKNESAKHINSLELLAVKFSLVSLLHGSHDIHVRIMSDNTTVVSYINEMGGCKSPQCNGLAKEIWEWAMARNIWLSAAHIPGCNNVSGDALSRKFSMELEWMFSKQVFPKNPFTVQ